jgi:hypothetical protein
MTYQPSAIVSMRFFINNSETSRTTQHGATSNTDFYDENNAKVGTAITKQAGGTFTTEYFDLNNTLIGYSKSTWAGTKIQTTYLDANKKETGTSTTIWGGTRHNTEYYDLSGEIIGRSLSTKTFTTTNTQDNLPIIQETRTYSTATNPSATFATKPIQNNSNKVVEKQEKSVAPSCKPSMKNT